MEEKQYPAEEQGIMPEETSGEVSDEMEIGEKEEDVYSEEGREKLVEDGEISAAEDAFMDGAEGLGEEGVCAKCGKPLSQEPGEVFEKEVEGQKRQFCSEQCAGSL